MGQLLVAKRYAEALYSLAEERNETQAVRSDMAFIAEAIKGSPELRAFIRNPVMSAGLKRKALGATLADHCGKLAAQMVYLLVSKRREPLLEDIALAFAQVYKHHNGIITVYVNSAVPINDEIRKSIKEKVLNSTEYPGIKEVELEERIKPELIAGMVVRVGDKQQDSSFARELSELKYTFSKNLYVATL
jgi:F-type H+-transporting ATPase subunit delta